MKNKKIDKKLLSAILTLTVFGLVMIASAGVIYSKTRFGESGYFFKHQLLYGFIPGLLILYFFQRTDYHFWKKMAFPAIIGSLFFLILVFVPGIGSEVYGANRWINLGPISFQPSEMAKISLIIYLAVWFESKGKQKIKDIYEGLFPFLGILGIISFLVIKQPDTGTMGAIIMIAMSIFFVSGARLSHIFGLIIAALTGLMILIKIEPYRMNRLLTFMNPEVDPQGIGYQINQALLAIGSGGIFGLGLGHSRQKFNYLPEPIGDSIFAVIGEELGLVGAIFLILLFVVVAFRGYRIAKNAPDEFGKLMAVGITSWIVFQAFINIAAISGIIPLTGIPLPFVSYGGTSLIFLMAGAGILLNISKQTKI
ncbi:MAG: Stage V sporulation protein E [Candidatus Moranbacteria bacterium GW2011_GWE2_35_2-]|nr:MAG: Stage V sporulation protein E [Candidatus Moranbacteria bacterium GW2011_GWE2_35_2-]KKQ06020.1 MAG: Stage V sporulation protein E [Candidatus Moranbacteria bacterium GW2011_GWF1_36_4]KKQ22814.1 MAG: Stage V sporulation protein E [Candidatus Moranbacteria bacterium GW2011_GWF2_37_11]KKQ28825.1 MAG: Stage V sporulation protein E [Candidatus Moranbacteria bacterium GW2011_GWD1_37_17]KKQ30955.1 MAG: Stage V sporulation protein E [Candidatus Moranbacteria bacterium GW2011_GWE1_37_24]KKQ4769